MAELYCPPAMSRKVLLVEAPGGRAVSADVVVPTITAVGEPFTVNVALADEMGYPSVSFGGTVTVRGASAAPSSVELTF